jgi:acetyl-CoA synthetase
MSDIKCYPIPDAFLGDAHIDNEKYCDLYRKSVDNNVDFWDKQGKRLNWITPYTIVKNVNYDKNDLHVKWYEDGELNVSVNCIDRHLKDRAEDTAIIWERDQEGQSQYISFQELHDEVCRFANVLKRQGVKKGDRVTLYMPMIPQAAYAMLACARIGAIHSVVFAGFSPEALAGRIIDCKSSILITADEGYRGGQAVPLKTNVDDACSKPGVSDYLKTVLVVKNTHCEVTMQDHDVWYHEEYQHVDPICEPEVMNAEDPLFILYTSGSTGKPKGVLHTSGGYLTYASMTHHYVFDYKVGDVYWCTADVGWITGHSYIVYGPLANGATTLMFEGVPNYPDFSRFWKIVDQHKVSIFYTAPTAIRALMKAGDSFVHSTSRNSLRVLGTVGEPINPEAWEWYYHVIGEERCAIVDTWWQTETGGIMITPLPGVSEMKPGSATQPFLGIQPALLDEQGNEIIGEGQGALVIKDSWPGQMRTIYGDHDRFISTYFSDFPGYYTTGDGALRDKDGSYWITGRTDDVINVSGHRLGTAEIESAMITHEAVAEAAVIGVPHDIKGEAIFVFVNLNNGFSQSKDLTLSINNTVRTVIGPIATPEYIQYVEDLPKTRSGKIMRRILRKIASSEYESLGDLSTLADPAVIPNLIQGHQIMFSS